MMMAKRKALTDVSELQAENLKLQDALQDAMKRIGKLEADYDHAWKVVKRGIVNRIKVEKDRTRHRLLADIASFMGRV